MGNLKILISPAKKMRVDTDTLAPRQLPRLLAQAETLKNALSAMDRSQLKALWKCSDAITDQNIARLSDMSLTERLTPAILSYEGIQYQYMAPGVMEESHLAYIETHLRILSGFYGVLRPFDGVTPYRLEMEAKLSLGSAKDLYAFWSDALAKALLDEGTDLVLNLASKEYSKAVEPYLPSHIPFITCVFGERIKGKIVEKGTLCKMARGRMVRYLAEHRDETLASLPDFSELGFRYSPLDSTEKSRVYLKEETK